jgi:predicted O-methyltransferase YrrM
MRDIGHWTPRTIGDRVRAVIDRSRNEEKPWLTPAASEILSSLLRSRDVGVEFGSGHSTLWFARRVARLTSVEHDRDWHTRVAAWLEREAIDNVDHRCVGTELAEEEDGAETAYAAQARRFDEGSLDFALVNGVYRSACATAILSKLRPGGVLVVENVNWFLPSDSSSPGSRGPADGPASDLWARFEYAVDGWRGVWTSSGITDTAFFLKPTALAPSPIVA